MPLRLGTPLPSLIGATTWLNDDGFNPDELAGAVLVHFWAISCHICHETMPRLLQYRERYEPEGLQFVSVHQPRQEADTDLAAVEDTMIRWDITQPTAIDNQHEVARAFQNEFVPAFYLFDARGKLCFRAAGDRGFENLEPKIRQLLGVTGG